MNEIFESSWVLVTGASMGLGAEIARQLAAMKANLVLAARSEDALQALATSLRDHGVTTRVVPCDLSIDSGMHALIDACRDLPIDHLINNAGFGSAGPFAELDPLREQAMVRLNCEAIVALTRALLPGMITRKRGGVLNIGSTASFQPGPTMATYCATKAFVLSFTLALHDELRGTGVRACVLCPGPVETGFQSAAGFSLGDRDKVAVLSAEDTVRAGLRAYARGDAKEVPGFINSVGAATSRMAPLSLVTRVTGKLLKRRS